MTAQNDAGPPGRPLEFLRREDGSWNLLPILAGALGLVFAVYLFA